MSDMISFGASDGEIDDRLFFLVALDAEVCSGSVTYPALLTLSSSRNARLRADEELICIMTNATPSRSIKDPGPRSPWIRRLRNPPEQPGSKMSCPSLATAGPPRKQPLLYLSPPCLAPGAEESVFVAPQNNHDSQGSRFLYLSHNRLYRV